jgi:uncharacterized membrane protein
VFGTAGSWAPGGYPPAAGAWPAGQSGSGQQWGQGWPSGGQQTGWTPPGTGAPAPRRRRLPALSGARLLAWTGGAVTLLGVVLLMVLAASRGWFSPPLRVAAGAVLGAALIGIGGWLHRRPSGRTGALAVTATGFATLYLVVAAATALYAYLAEVPALVVALVVAGGGLGLADRWRSQLLGTGVVAGAALLAPALTAGWLLVALVLALQLAALPVVLRRDWPVLMLVAAAGPVLYGVVEAVRLAEGTAGELSTVAVALAALVVGLGTAAPAARLVARPPAVALLVVASAIPTVAAGSALDGWPGALVVLAAALGAAVVASLTRGQPAVRLTAGATAALAVFQATVTALDGAAMVTVLLAQAVLAAVVATATRSRFLLVVGLVLGGIGVLAGLPTSAPPPVSFPQFPYAAGGVVSQQALITAAGIAALVLAVAVALLVACGRLGWVRPDAASARLWAPIGLVGLYGAGTLVITVALLISPDRTGFTAGHALVTVSWTVAALVLLARGITRPALRVTGLVLVAAAVAKLVLFDLVALDGIARVVAFLGAGLLLLAAGTRYARLVAEADPPATPR